MSHSTFTRKQPTAASSGSFLPRGQQQNHRDGASDAIPEGGSPPPPQLPVGPSVIFDETTGSAVAAPVSLPVSQLFSSQAMAGAGGSGQPLTRQRPRFQTVQDLDMALNEAIEGRINSKNAWASKEASNLLEGITHTIESTLDANTANDYSGFTKAATVVEGCSKVWTVRVDSTYHQSNQMLQRLLRNDDTAAGGSGNGVHGESDADGADGVDNALSGARRRSQRAAAAAAAAAARTLALNASEINLDSKARTSLTQTGINAQFRAITEKFDQGNAQGLLMSNAPLGAMGNVILDVDYARMDGEFSARRARRARLSGESGDSNVAAAVHEAADGTPSSVDLSARPSRHGVAQDAEINATLEDLPDLTDLTSCGDSPSGNNSTMPETNGQRGSMAPRSLGGSGARLSGAGIVVDELLLLPHAAMKIEMTAADGATNRTGTVIHGQDALPNGNGEGHSSTCATNNEEDDVHDDYGGDGDWGGDWDDGGGDRSPANEAEASAAAGGGRDVGEAARHLVSGLTEMAAVDAYLGSHRRDGNMNRQEDGRDAEMNGSSDRHSFALAGAQLALEAEDPSAWCPLTDVPANPLAGVALNSELSRLRRQHRLAGAAGGGGNSAISDSTIRVTAAATASGRRAKKEKTVVFDLTEAQHMDASAAAITSCTLFALGKADASNSSSNALKQSTTAAKNMTPLGKEILLSKDASQRVLAYTQSAFQKAKAEQSNLLLPSDPVPGETVPSYLSFPITVNGFFQPFSTSHASWNLLRKSAAGHLIEGAANATTGRGADAVISSNSAGVGSRNGRDGSVLGEDGEAMPVAFFAGGAEADDGTDADYDGGGIDDYYGNIGDVGDGHDDHGETDDAYMRAELQLLRQFDNQQQQQRLRGSQGGEGADPDALMASAVASARSSGQLLARMEPDELLRVLQPSEAVLPTQVDVVGLRRTMWTVLRELANLSVGDDDSGGAGSGINRRRAVTAATARGEADNSSEDEREAREGKDSRTGAERRPLDKESALKTGALRLLASSQAKLANGKGDHVKRTNTKDIAESEYSGAATLRSGDRRKRSRAAVEEEDHETASSSAHEPESDADEVKEGLADHRVNFAKDGQLRFSKVVEALLPQVSAISSTGTLSPAFFFFSILFLANEHSIVLKNMTSLNDLIIDVDSLVNGGGTIVRAESAKRRKTTKSQTASSCA